MHRGRVHRKAWNFPSHAHELTFTCYHRYKFLAAERVRLWLSHAIEEARIGFDFAVWGFVFMPEHVHLIVFPRRPRYDISAILRAIKQPVARKAMAYMRRHAPHWLPKLGRQRGKRVEYLFWQSGGGYDRNIKSFDTLFRMIGYAHENPVKRGLVERAVDWNWSSAAWYEKLRDGPIRIDPIE